ncbi:NB-ARC domain-containing protein [Nonomuraea jabiensis]|uniref:tetratricopeptide repeat protein n=1 Tax=Nonomuraea jabiensis TaxID=882448 RepID=UPI003415D08B
MVATISGNAGIGKTALAVHATRHLGEAFPHGCFYVDLRGMDNVPLAPGTALSRLLKALGAVEQGIPHEEEERAGLYRSVLGQRRCLIVLDDAADEAQVRPLLPARGPGMTIVSSRRSLAGLEGVRQIPLDQLSSEEAAGLLRSIVGEERAAADSSGVAQLAIALDHLGAAYAELERWEEAIEAYQQAMPALRARPIGLALGCTQARLGFVLWRAGRVEEARERTQRRCGSSSGPVTRRGRRRCARNSKSWCLLCLIRWADEDLVDRDVVRLGDRDTYALGGDLLPQRFGEGEEWPPDL